MKVRNALVGAAAAVLAPTLAAVAPQVAVASAPAGGDQLYVTNGGSDTDPNSANIARFGIAANGLVRPVATVPSGPAGGLVFTPNLGAGQRFAYSANDADVIDRYRVGPGGALTFVGTTETPQPFGIAIDPHGRTVFVANFNDGEGNGGLSAFHVDGPVARAQIGPSGHRVVITPDGRFLYVTMQEEGDAGDVLGFRIGASGQLTPVSAKPFEAGTWVEGAAVSPDGRRLYVVALGVVGGDPTPIADGEVRGFDIGADGRLTAVARVASGSDPNDLAVGLDSRHLYVGDFTGNTVTVFAVGARGVIKPLQTVSSQGLGPSFQGVTVQPRHL